MDDDRQLYEQAKLLAQRLERISVDSVWARRSSGHRGALLRWIERLEAEEGNIELNPDERARLNALIEAGFIFLNRAARERLR
jgi:hypothetical protein